MQKTVKDLIEELSQLDQDLPVIMSRDSEGNDYEDFSDADIMLLTEDDAIHAEDDPWVSGEENVKPVLVLWPGGKRYE
jgi:hypothetical protein